LSLGPSQISIGHTGCQQQHALTTRCCGPGMADVDVLSQAKK